MQQWCRLSQPISGLEQGHYRCGGSTRKEGVQEAYTKSLRSAASTADLSGAQGLMMHSASQPTKLQPLNLTLGDEVLPVIRRVVAT